jgi:hypothetical protein
MKWRVMVELIGNDGTVHAHEVNAGGSNTAECSAETVGLTLADGKRTLAGLQDQLVQAQTQEYCRQRGVGALPDGGRDGPNSKLLCGDRLATDRIRASGQQHPV